jgi:ATP/maltotriose-dependent transcriptional regulator MalT
VDIANRWTESARRLTDKFAFAPGQLLIGKTYALSLAGHLFEAEALAEKGYRWAVEQHSHDGTADWALLQGRVALARGRPGTASRWLMEAAALFRSPSGVNFLPACLAGFTHATTLAGDRVAAERALADAEQALSSRMALFEPELAIARAWVAAAAGELSKARSVLLDAADVAEGIRTGGDRGPRPARCGPARRSEGGKRSVEHRRLYR